MTDHPLHKHLPGISRISLGCMSFGGGWDNTPLAAEDLRLLREAVDAALEGGINFFDHADIYTFGKAEQAFGKVLAERPNLREEIFIQSKCGIRFEDANGPKRYDFSKEWLLGSVDNILTRLNTDYLDVLLLHRPDPLMEVEEIADAFCQLKSAGKVRFFGASNMHLHQLAHLQSVLSMPLVANQIEISLQRLAWLDEGVLVGNSSSRAINFTPGTLQYCTRQHIQIQSWGSLCQGLFSGRDLTGQSEAIIATANRVAELAETYTTSREAIVLAWLMRHPIKVQPIIGTSSPTRITACSKATEITLTRGEWYELYQLARGESLP